MKDHHDLDERSRKILEAIVDEHITLGEPIGSKAVAHRPGIGLSAATVRNVMADLEGLGYISSPHRSAGRIPTERGYRFYIDALLRIRNLSRSEQTELEMRYGLQGLGAEELLRRASQALSEISSYAGIVLAPRFTSTILRRVEFIKLSQGRVLVVLVTESGLVQNKLIEVEDALGQEDLVRAANYLNGLLTGLSMAEARRRIVREMTREKALYDQLKKRALRLSRQAFQDAGEEQVFIEGAAKILDQPEFADVERMRRLFRAFEQKSLLVDLLDKSQRAEGIRIFLGSETEFRDIEGCSLITSTYSSSRGNIGALGVIGPTRMPYSQVIPIVDYTARIVSQALARESD